MAGKPVHVEIAVSDAAEGREFWGSLLGWQFEEYEGSGYHMARLGDDSGAAVYTADDGANGVRVYFDVDDVSNGASRVRELGGDAGEKTPVPSMGWFVHCTDPSGNEFGLWETDPSASM